MLQRLFKWARSFVPRPLPTGLKAFDSWVIDIIALSGLPNNVSTRQAAASFIIQLRPTAGFISLRMAVNLLVKAAANQVALQVLKDASSEQQTQQSTIS